MTSRQEWIDRVKAQLDLCNAEIARIEAKAKIARVDARAKVDDYLDRLRENREEATAKLHQLQTESGEALGEVSKGFETAWSDLAEAFKRARTKFGE